MNKLERVRKVFEESKKSQTELARILDVTPQYVWKIVKTDSEPSDRIILAILNAFPDINADWLKNGTGEMIEPKTKEQEIADIVASIYKDDNDFRKKLIKAIAGLDEYQLNVLQDLAAELAEKKSQD